MSSARTPRQGTLTGTGARFEKASLDGQVGPIGVAPLARVRPFAQVGPLREELARR